MPGWREPGSARPRHPCGPGRQASDCLVRKRLGEGCERLSAWKQEPVLPAAQSVRARRPAGPDGRAGYSSPGGVWMSFLLTNSSMPRGPELAADRPYAIGSRPERLVPVHRPRPG